MPAADPPQPIVFATDFHTSTIDAIRYAARLSQLTGAPLHCLHVLPRTLEAAGQSWIVPEIMSEALMQIATHSGLGLEAPTCATIYGSEISNAIVDYAKQRNARLIVLGVRQASMLATHLPEHIAYRIITEAPCPVLTMAFGTPAHNAASAENSVSQPTTSFDREPSQPTQQQ
jgi:K+-sensing histidine kinase KdpD